LLSQPAKVSRLADILLRLLDTADRNLGNGA